MNNVDIRKIVVDRMEELGVNTNQLAERTGVNRQTLYGFLRDPKDAAKLADDSNRRRSGNIGSESLAAILEALQLAIKPTR